MQIVKNDDFEDENSSGQCLTNIYIKKISYNFKKINNNNNFKSKKSRPLVDTTH